MATFRLADVIPMVEQVVNDLIQSEGVAFRDEVALYLLQNEPGRTAVETAFDLDDTGRSKRAIAGNMVDWFSAKFDSDDLTETARSRLGRRKSKGKWAYFSLEAPPNDVAFDAVDTRDDSGDAHDIRPAVFLSYSHDNDQHKEWVRRLASNLEQNGIRAILDQWDLQPGQDATLFMETGVRDSNRVVVVCTPNYVNKAANGYGGVGYERMIITGEMVSDLGTNKFIPVIRAVGDPMIPSFLASRIYVSFCETDDYADSLDQLARVIHNVPRHRRPEPGSSPYTSDGAGRAKVTF